MSARGDLPTGTVTLVFADIEGSTHLLESLGAAYATVLARERQLARSSVRAAGGVEVDTAGDGAFFAFATAHDALTAAAATQRALAAEQWPDGVAVRVRIGIHTGTPVVAEEGYVGIDVHRAARICGVAHGGQVVISQQTRELLGDALAPDMSLRALGAHRLRDVPEPMPLYQLVGDGLDDGFAPLRALGAAALPPLHHRLVGRVRERAEIEALLEGGRARLVTVTGPGGAGKSRLALEVAFGRADTQPVTVVGLASISESSLVPAAVGRAIGVREQGTRDIVDEIALALAGRNVLLVLDNLEHLPGAADTVARLLAASFDTTILATSRVPLHLSAEHVLALAPLPVADAVALFDQLAAARGARVPDGSEPVVREICRRLDGLPLAIELVVARLSVLPPTALLAALEAGLALTAEGPIDLPERQRTLRATIDWSYGLLGSSERELHMLLSVFVGGATIHDVQAVRPDTDVMSDLVSLVDGSLIRVEADGGEEPRVSMLDTVREYATGRLDAVGGLDAARALHMRLFLQRAEAAEAGLAGPEQRVWLDRLEADHDNLRAALQHALATGRVEALLRAVSATGRFWRAHGHVREARHWLGAGLSSGIPVDAEIRAQALWTDARQAMAQGSPSEALPILADALALFRARGDGPSTVFALCELSQAHLQLGDLVAAGHEADAGLEAARATGDPRILSAALNTVAGVAVERGDHGTARTLYEESLQLRRALDDPLLVVNSANNLGLAAFRHGDLDAARQALEECLGLARELGDDLHSASALCALGELALVAGATERAQELLLEAYTVYGTLEDERMQAECMQALGGVAAATGRYEAAAALWGGADAIRRAAGAAVVPEEQLVLSHFEPVVRQNLGAARLGRALDEGRRAGADELLAWLPHEERPGQ